MLDYYSWYSSPTLTMFSIPYHGSTGTCVALIIVFGITEFTSLANSIPADEQCVNVSGESICYFNGSERDVAWDEAKRQCSSLNSTLPTIRNKNEQDTLVLYLQSHNMSISTAWTSGKNFTNDEWTWINGEPLNDTAKLQENHDGKEDVVPVTLDHGTLDQNFTLQAHAAHETMHYICQYKGVSCDVSRDSNVAVEDGCFKLSDDSLTWYDARNQCLMNGGDLAVICDNASTILKQRNLQYQYWIGLRKKSWRWMRNDNVESGDEIKYTNWDNIYATDGECIFIDASGGKWKAIGCSESRAVVCQRGQGMPSTTTMRSIQTSADSFTSVFEESTTGESQNSRQQSLLFLAVGAGIVIIIICIVVIIFALRSTKNSGKQIAQQKFNNISSKNNLEEFEYKPTNRAANTLTNAPANAPTNCQPVHGADDILGVYADIPLAAINQSEENATSHQPGVVYASIELQKEPTYAEPNKKRDNPTTPTKVGPLGDTYAIPDVKGHAVSSPGTSSVGSNSHPIKITAQGDVYALPVKNTNSPTENPPGGAVYANLQI